MSDDALIRLGRSTSEAISGVLESFAPGRVQPGEVTVVSDPFARVPVPAVATSVSYVDGVTGGNVFLMTVEGARRLAAAMMGMEQPEEPDAPELSELELSAVAEAMNQMMASAAIAISSVLGTDVEIGTPETRTFAAPGEARDAYPGTPHAIGVTLSVCEEPCQLVQLVPNAFVVRMTRALDELGTEVPSGHDSPPAAPARPSLTGIPVRVWAELGRAHMTSAHVVGMPPGAVVELNRGAEEPIDVYVNGRRFATGRLVVVDGTDWAIRIDTIVDGARGANGSGQELTRWPDSW